MTLPDFVEKTLDFLDSNWNTSRVAKPVLIDGDEMTYYANDTFAKETSAVNTAIITADSSPTGTNEILGDDYDLRVRRGVGIDIEGYHDGGGGTVTDKDEFNTIVDEARQAIYTNRTFPADGMKDLMIEQEDDLSPTQGDAYYFRYTFDVWWEGFEDLPD